VLHFCTLLIAENTQPCFNYTAYFAFFAPRYIKICTSIYRNASVSGGQTPDPYLLPHRSNLVSPLHRLPVHHCAGGLRIRPVYLPTRGLCALIFKQQTKQQQQ